MSTIYRPVSRGVYPLSRRQAGQLGPAALRVSNLLAIGSDIIWVGVRRVCAGIARTKNWRCIFIRSDTGDRLSWWWVGPGFSVRVQQRARRKDSRTYAFGISHVW